MRRTGVLTESLKEALQNSKIIICAGSGGVGKTSLSAALSLLAVENGKRVLVLTVDPAQRLMTSLGLKASSDEIVRVDLGDENKRLYAGMIQSKKIFDDFIKRHTRNSELANKIFKNKLYQQLSTTLSGSQEFTALEKLLFEFESHNYDLIILDTPPTQHALDFFVAPQRIINLFQDSITKWFVIPDELASGFFANLFYKGTKSVFKSLELLTGGQFIVELADFFSSMKSIQQVLRERSLKIESLLKSKGTQFFLITSFDMAKLKEAEYLYKELVKLNFRLSQIIINRAFPQDVRFEEPKQYHECKEEVLALLVYFQEFKKYYNHKFKMYDEFAEQFEDQVNIIRIPEYVRDICGLDDLKLLGDFLNKGEQ